MLSILFSLFATCGTLGRGLFCCSLFSPYGCRCRIRWLDGVSRAFRRMISVILLLIIVRLFAFLFQVSTGYNVHFALLHLLYGVDTQTASLSLVATTVYDELESFKINNCCPFKNINLL